jgi:hypothetical protein
MTHLSHSFLMAMVMAMYVYEAKQHLNPNLLTDAELL